MSLSTVHTCYVCSCVVYASQKKLYLFLAAKLEIFTVLLPGLTTSLDNLKKSRLLPDETDDAWWSSERTSKWICYNWQVRCIFQSFFYLVNKSSSQEMKWVFFQDVHFRMFRLFLGYFNESHCLSGFGLWSWFCQRFWNL